jgi:hypothetical protein
MWKEILMGNPADAGFLFLVEEGWTKSVHEMDKIGYVQNTRMSL